MGRPRTPLDRWRAIVDAGGRRGCGWPEYGGSVRELRDAALLAIMSDGLLRVSEAADLEAEGANTLTVRRSKTDQEGEGTASTWEDRRWHGLQA